MLWALPAQTQAKGPVSLGEWSVIAANFAWLVLVVLLAVSTVTWIRRRRAIDAQAAAAARANMQREQFHFEQGQSINQTGLKKMQLETQLLQTQVQIAEHELASRQRHEQINSVAIEKLRLEVESLKLHIREQHKRLDDFSSGYE